MEDIREEKGQVIVNINKVKSCVFFYGSNSGYLNGFTKVWPGGMGGGGQCGAFLLCCQTQKKGSQNL